ncbi:MAG: GHKL domain-containing protein [Dorea sp.]|nr:GHKL domain-containing protein [Dorea sp.]
MNIQIENSIKDTPKVRNGIYMTTKSRKEGHGIGLQNVKLVVEKYHGQMEICHTEKSFQVKILLYMKLDEKE